MAQLRPINLLRLRLLTGYLGERAQFAWWPTGFFDPTSRPFLEPVFAKSPRLAQYHGVVEAARRQHDENLSVGSYHLFRLPEENEQDLHGLIRSPEGGQIASALPTGKDAALAELKGMAGGLHLDREGPAVVGNVGDLGAEEVIRKVAAVYASAFMRQVKSYPYLAP